MLTTSLTDSSGAFSVEVTIPTAYTGAHTLVALGLGPDQTVLRALTLPITIAAVPVSPASGGLVVTGPALTATIGLALALLAVGVGAVIAARRRRPRPTAGATDGTGLE